MECNEVENLLSKYIENDVSENIHNKIFLHIKKCDKCKQLKEKIENLISTLPELEEDIPFFVKNRLYYIPESQETKKRKFFHLRWAAAVIGMFVLFLNLFYFTNIYPQANRVLHSIVAKIEKFAVETEAFIEKMKESKELFSSSEEQNSSTDELNDYKKLNKKDNRKIKGGKNG